MQDDVKKVFYFHADASSIGGFVVEGQSYRHIPTQASVALPTVGGHSVDRGKEFKFDDVISCRSSYTHVKGEPRKVNGPWIERVTAVVEGLDIAGVLTAERVVARAFVEKGEDGQVIGASFAGSHFENLRVEREPVKVVINSKLMPVRRYEDATSCYNEEVEFTTEVQWADLWKVAEEQSATFRDEEKWLKDRFGTAGTEAKDGHTICSLVDRIEGGPYGRTIGHTVVVPDVGRFFLGEVFVNPRSLQITMVRAELGCKTTGQVSAATATTNGSTWPPGH
jgi:hypothetical protein